MKFALRDKEHTKDGECKKNVDNLLNMKRLATKNSWETGSWLSLGCY